MNLFKGKPAVSTDPQKIGEILSRSVSAVYPSAEELKKALSTGKRLKIYLGADATGSQLHLGHATNLILIEKLRKLGHEVVFLFGDFTAMIGDPTDKSATRIQLTEQEVKKNISSWKAQVGKIINLNDRKNPVTFVKNSSWLSKLDFSDLIKLASNFTVQQMIERDMFEKRIDEKKPIYLHEFFYPLMQGYDSVALDVDVEVGGNDQTFNMLAGRTLQKAYNNRSKFVIATTLLVNPKTNKKLMSKSEGGYIALDDSAENMFGKVMALPDETLIQMFVDCTYVSMEEITKIKELLANGDNPRNIKFRLAKEIVTIYHGADAAQKSADNFENVFKDGAIPDDAAKASAAKGDKLVDVLLREKIVASKSDFRRLIDGNAISYVGGESISDHEYKIEKAGTIRVGKKRFITITLS